MDITNKTIYDELLEIKEYIRAMKLEKLGVKRECEWCKHWVAHEDKIMGECRLVEYDEHMEFVCYANCEYFEYKKDL